MSNHYKYYWKILDGIHFYMCYDISFYKEKVGEALAKGQKVLMPMENNNDNGVMQNEADRWQKKFPNAQIQWLDKSNTDEWYWLKEALQEEGDNPLDLLICSPVWSAGIDIQNKFDLVAGNFSRSGRRIQDGKELFNCLTRERHPREIIAMFNRKGIGEHWDWHEKIISPDINTFERLLLSMEYINDTQADKLNFNQWKLYRPLEDGTPVKREGLEYLIEGLIEVATEESLSKANSLQELPDIATNYGANVIYKYPISKLNEHRTEVLKPEVKIYDQNRVGKPNYAREIKTAIN